MDMNQHCAASTGVRGERVTNNTPAVGVCHYQTLNISHHHGREAVANSAKTQLP
jgi:hypothetical protein